MRRLSPQQVAMLRRVAKEYAAIPHEWTGAKRTGADRTRQSLSRDDLIRHKLPFDANLLYVLTDAGRVALAEALTTLAGERIGT